MFSAGLNGCQVTIKKISYLYTLLEMECFGISNTRKNQKRHGYSLDLTVKKIKKFPDCKCTVDILFCMEYILLICHQGVENILLGF